MINNEEKTAVGRIQGDISPTQFGGDLRAAPPAPLDTGVRTRADHDCVTLEGEIRDVSILVADLRGFTTLAEQLTPSRMATILNDYLTVMVDVILAHHGMVQDFVGDGILAVFGAPTHDADHTWHAVMSAIEMQAAIKHLRWSWGEQLIAFAMGVAVHSGEVFAGTVGSPRKPKYAVVGDTVNTTARLEELNRELGTSIVLSGEALAMVRNRVNVYPRGPFMVRGRSHTVEVFELLDVPSALVCRPMFIAGSVATPVFQTGG